jgi:hypothetical protein
MCDFEEQVSWPGLRVGRCGVCGVRQRLTGSIEIGHRDGTPLERFELCMGCQARSLDRGAPEVHEGALRARIADDGEGLCRYLLLAQVAEIPVELLWPERAEIATDPWAVALPEAEAAARPASPVGRVPVAALAGGALHE